MHLNVEEALRCVKSEYGSGKKLAEKIREMAEQYDEPLLLYLDLIRTFSGIKEVGDKIANAIINEIGGEPSLFKNCKKDLQNLFAERWFRNLFLASTLNIMIDTHVRKFFEKKLGMKQIDKSLLIIIARYIDKKLIEEVFNYSYCWAINEYFEKEEIKKFLENYYEYIGASLLEKIIWKTQFVKANAKKEVKKFMEEHESFSLFFCEDESQEKGEN
ncbi:MAG: hypothetical protein QXW47_09980 [Candidatus Jordarchaeales archaeon]